MTLLRLSRPMECRRCREGIAVGEAAIAYPVAYSSSSRWSAYHPSCLLDVVPHALARALSETDTQRRAFSISSIAFEGLDALSQPAEIAFEGRDELFERAKQRAALFDEIVEDEKRRRRRKVVEGEAPRPRIDEIARDAKGRPRVSIVWAMLGFDSIADWPLRDQVMPDQTFASSLREYVLLDATKQRPLPLPWQPLIGALFALSSQAKVTRRVLERLLQWRSFGLRTPVLWIVGSGGPERDSVVRKMRSALDEAGFVGDEAACVCSESFSREALVELGAAMDQALSIESPPALAPDQREAALIALEAVVNERRRSSYAPALVNVAKRLRGMTPAMKERAANCAIACLIEESARSKAVELLSALSSRPGVPEIRAALIDMLRESRTVSSGALEVWSLLVVWRDEALDPALCDLVCSEEKASARSLRWLGLLSECTDPAVVGRLKRWAMTLSEGDARRARVLEIVERATPRVAARDETETQKTQRSKSELLREDERS